MIIEILIVISIAVGLTVSTAAPFVYNHFSTRPANGEMKRMAHFDNEISFLNDCLDKKS